MGRREFGCRTRTGPGGTQPQRVQQPLQRRHSNAPPPLIGLSNPEIRKNGVQQPASRLTTPPTPSIPCEKPVPEGVCVCVWDEADWRGWFSGEGGFHAWRREDHHKTHRTADRSGHSSVRKSCVPVALSPLRHRLPAVRPINISCQLQRQASNST